MKEQPIKQNGRLFEKFASGVARATGSTMHLSLHSAL